MYLKPYFVRSNLKLVMNSATDVEEKPFDVLESIKKHIALLKPKLPEKMVICVGEYPSKILLEGRLAERLHEVEPLFIGKSSKEILTWARSGISDDMVLGLSEKAETHYWYNVLSYMMKDDAFSTRLKEKSVHSQFDDLILSSSWEGVGSALTPFLVASLIEAGMNAVALTILPSSVQPSDVQFNALYSVGSCLSHEGSAVVLLDRDLLESFTGVSRDGTLMKGNLAVNYMMELMLTKDYFVQELSELSRAFNMNTYTIIPMTGASFRLYESLENMLNSAISKPLLKFDLSSSSILYVLVRIPERLKESLTQGKIELSIANWFRGKANLKSIYVGEPIYVNEMSDRIDILLFVGGFTLTNIFSVMEKRVKDVKNDAIDKGFLKEDDWQGIVGRLVKA
jgi:hypothetical protein